MSLSYDELLDKFMLMTEEEREAYDPRGGYEILALDFVKDALKTKDPAKLQHIIDRTVGKATTKREQTRKKGEDSHWSRLKLWLDLRLPEEVMQIVYNGKEEDED